MEERRNKRRFILLLVMTVVTLGVFWWIQPENRMDIDQTLFQVEELQKINRVSLASANGEVDLRFDGNRWRVNDTYPAEGDMVRVLFATLQQAKPKRAVADTRRDSIYNELKKSGVEVSLYEEDELKKQFLAGGNAGKTQAFFAIPESEEVYVVTIPGYRVYVSGIFELPEGGWRDKFVFGFNWRNFKSLKTEFPGNPQQNFTVSMQNNQFGIEGLQQVDTAKLNNFLDAVSLLTVDEYISEPGLTDSLLSLRPQMTIRVTDVGNRIFDLHVYGSGPGSAIWGLIRNAQPALFDPRKIDFLLKPKSFFRKK